MKDKFNPDLDISRLGYEKIWFFCSAEFSTTCQPPRRIFELRQQATMRWRPAMASAGFGDPVLEQASTRSRPAWRERELREERENTWSATGWVGRLTKRGREKDLWCGSAGSVGLASATRCCGSVAVSGKAEGGREFEMQPEGKREAKGNNVISRHIWAIPKMFLTFLWSPKYFGLLA